MNVNRVDTDVLIIGSGIAGLKASLEASKLGKQVVLVSKSPVGKANNTIRAGGGFAFTNENFSPEKHIQKTVDSGRLINDQTLVEYFIAKAPSEVKDLVEIGLEGDFDKSGFHCRSPFLMGGPKITEVLVRACRAAHTRIIENIMITDLIVDEENCLGALGFHKRTAEWYGFCSKAVILATGGAGAIYVQNDNAPGATGDGYALAVKAGLELMDMEFVQFYPLVYAGSGRSSMILLPSFADAGKIVNRYGEDIKEKYHVHKKPVAIVSRDQLSQALFQEITQGNGVDGALFLDLRNIDDKKIPYRDELKARYKNRIAYDSEPVKIRPACHHTMGGIPIDVYGHTTLKGLYAAGEVTAGIHGANRMGGNALSEALVFGGMAGRAASDYVGSVNNLEDFEILLRDYTQKWDQFLTLEDQKKPTVHSVIGHLKQILWEKAGIIRDETSLREGIEQIDGIFQVLQSQSSRKPYELCKIVECRNAALTGMAIAVSAIEREESRGSHYREDFPFENSDWKRNIHVRLIDSKPTVSRIVPVNTSQS